MPVIRYLGVAISVEVRLLEEQKICFVVYCTISINSPVTRHARLQNGALQCAQSFARDPEREPAS